MFDNEGGFSLEKLWSQPAHEIMKLIAYVISKISDKPAQMRSLIRAFVAYMCTQSIDAKEDSDQKFSL